MQPKVIEFLKSYYPNFDNDPLTKEVMRLHDLSEADEADEDNYIELCQEAMEIAIYNFTLSDEPLKRELEKRGYLVEWSDFDVQHHIDEYNQENGTNYELDFETRMCILNEVLGSDSDHSDDNDQLAWKVEDYIKEKYELE